MKKYSALILSALVLSTFALDACKSAQKRDSAQDMIIEGRYDEAKELFKTKRNIDETDEEGNTALHIAALVNQADMAGYLIAKGANTEIKNANGDTPLLVAVKNNSIDAARVLAIVYGDIFAKDKAGNTALEIALSKGDKWYDAMISEQTGSVRDVDGQSIVHYFVKTRDEKAVQRCINQKIPLSVKDKNGKTPLHLAFESPENVASIRIAAALILAGADSVGGDFEYFETAVTNHNMMQRFDDGQTALHLATIQGHTGIAAYIISNNGTISLSDILSAQDMNGTTPLHEAVRYGHADITRLLLAKGASVNAMDSIGKTPILLIIPTEAEKEIYTTLLEYNADVKQKDMFGDTVLHVATMNRADVSVLESLINNGAAINDRNKKGVTPLSLAIENKVAPHILFYAQHGADLYAEDMNGNTPLSKVFDDNSTELLKTLITEETVTTKDSAGNTPLHLAVMYNAPVSSVDYLISIGADVNARNKNGDSVLYIAAAKNKKEIGQILLDNNADIFATNTQNESPLKIALMNKKVQDWLITSKTLNKTDGSGNTPLHYAAEWNLFEASKMLVERGANVKATNANGESAVFSAVKSDNANIIQLLAKNHAVLDSTESLGRDNSSNTPIHAAVRWNALNSIQTLKKFGVDINAQNMSGKTALSYSCRAGKTELASLLLKNGADIDATDLNGRTILMDTIQTKNEEMVRFLLANNASVQIQEMNGRNAFHEAALSKNIDIITMVRNAGGNPLNRDSEGESPFTLVLGEDFGVILAVLGPDTSITDSDGNTPVHIAVEKEVSAEMLAKLLEEGYPATQRNAQGVTALHKAVSQNSQELAKVLLENGSDPFLETTDGENAITAVFKTKNWVILDAIVKYNKTKTDRNGDTILHYAARTADEETMLHLLAIGLDKNIKNLANETPAQIAKRWERKSIAQMLL